MRSVFFCLLVMVVSVLSSILPAEAQLPPGMLTVYSNLCFNSMSGDLNGLRIIVFRSATWNRGEAYPPTDDTENVYVIYQGTGGLLAPPRYVLATHKGGQIRIPLPRPDEPDLAFVGRITPEVIEGRHLGYDDKRYLLMREPEPKNKFTGCTASGNASDGRYP
ncbi:MAG: hypothetical protein ACM3II_17725 [Rhodospirillaceae bacterium]